MLRIILLATALVISGCGSKEKAAEGKEATKESVKSSGKKASSKATTAAKSAVSETIESITCSYNNDQRKISSVKLADGGCEVHYEKFSEKKVVARANFDLGYCSQMANKVSNNLEEAGFTCK